MNTEKEEEDEHDITNVRVKSQQVGFQGRMMPSCPTYLISVNVNT